MSKMLEFERVASLIHSLSKRELKYVLSSFIKSNSVDNAKSISIIRYLGYNKDASIEYVLNDLYNGERVAFKKLMQRILYRMLELLADNECITDLDVYDARGQAMLSIKKRLIYYDILVKHGINNFALHFLEAIIKDCYKYENYEYLLIALYRKQAKFSLRFGVNEYEKIAVEIRDVFQCNNVLKYSSNILYNFAAKQQYYSPTIDEEIVLDGIRMLQDNNKVLKSKSIRIAEIFLNIALYDSRKDYIRCRKELIYLLEYRKKNKHLSYDSDFYNNYINLARIEILLFNFDKALWYLKEVVRLDLKSELNERIRLEYVFLSYFYKSCLSDAEDVIIQLSSPLKEDKLAKHLYSKYIFYYSNIEFIKGNFKLSLRKLDSLNSLDKDKKGWNIGVRLLLIMNLIELAKYDLADTHIENLRKHISRHEIMDKLDKRFHIINRVLISLSRNSYNFKVVNLRNESDLKKLNAYKDEYKWNLMTPEMVVFNSWFHSKVKGIKYDHRIAVMKGKI